MKKIIYTFIAIVSMGAMFSSCEKDAMEINFTQTDNHISDYSGIIKAINDQTKSLEAKLALIEAAIDNQTLTVSQKLDILTAAVENGVLTIQQMADKIVDAIEDQTVGLNEKLALIEAAIKNQTLTIGQKFDLLNTAVENGVLKIEELAQKIAELTEAMDQPTLYKDPQDNSALYLDPAVWGALSDDALNEALKGEAANMSLTDNGATQLFQTGAYGTHGIYEYERRLFSAGTVGGVPNTDITKPLTKYVAKETKRIFKAWNSASHPEWRPYVTDVDGTNQLRTFTLTDLANGSGNPYQYTCIITLWKAPNTWATEYGVYSYVGEM